jgi:hypothetical protein
MSEKTGFMPVRITIPRSWDGFEGIEGIAEAEGISEYVALQESVANGSWSKRGKGYSLTIELRSKGELSALSAEAKYRDEYWNTDDYGIKEGGASDPVRGRAARVVKERVEKLESA